MCRVCWCSAVNYRSGRSGRQTAEIVGRNLCGLPQGRLALSLPAAVATRYSAGSVFHRYGANGRGAPPQVLAELGVRRDRSLTT